MKILNLYAGIGGNRKHWDEILKDFDYEIVAIEHDPKIAKIYQDFFPNDKVIVGDAHQYLLDHYKEFDFIWSSPPCPTHSDIRRCGVHKGQYPALYPEMSLYQEIILLTHFAKKGTKWIVENVKPYYKPLIPGKLLKRHLFWSNFVITDIDIKDTRTHNAINGNSVIYGFDLKEYDFNDKRKLLRNMVNPELGKHILEEVINPVKTLL